ncbi:MAG: outer membrane beta-barrel protein [Candidatus Omnitrophota bacterium]
MKIKLLIFVLISIFFIGDFSFAQRAEEEKYIQYPTAGRPEKIKDVKGKFRAFVTAMQGFDNNANLDSSRKGDLFQEAIINADYRYSFSKKTSAGALYNFTVINYDKYTKNTLLDNILKLDWTRKLFKIFTFQKFYQIEYLAFPKDDNSSYVENDLGFSLRHDIYKGLYHAFKFTFLTKNYTARNRRLADYNFSDKKRFDYRSQPAYEIGIFFKKLYAKVSYQFYVNKSNELYLDYYDFYSNRGVLSLGYNFTEKLLGYTSFGFQKRQYKDRRWLDGNPSPEKEYTYTFNASLSYNFTKYLSSILDYSYRENVSNVPSQKYSGSLTTVGLNYTF